MGWNKAVPRREFIMIQIFFKKYEKSQINNLTYHLKELEKEKQTKLERGKGSAEKKEILKTREEIEILKVIGKKSIKTSTDSLKRLTKWINFWPGLL